MTGKKDTRLTSNNRELCHFAKTSPSTQHSIHGESVGPFTEQRDQLYTHITVTVYTGNIFMTTRQRQANCNQKLEKLTQQQSNQENNVFKWHKKSRCSTYQSRIVKENSNGLKHWFTCQQSDKLDQHEDKINLIYLQLTVR